MAASIDILNLRYRGSVEDEVHHVLSACSEFARSLGRYPDTLEDVWVAVATGEIEEARVDVAPVLAIEEGAVGTLVHGAPCIVVVGARRKAERSIAARSAFPPLDRGA